MKKQHTEVGKHQKTRDKQDVWTFIALPPRRQHRIYSAAISRHHRTYFDIMPTDEHITPHALFCLKMVFLCPKSTSIDYAYPTSISIEARVCNMGNSWNVASLPPVLQQSHNSFLILHFFCALNEGVVHFLPDQIKLNSTSPSSTFPPLTPRARCSIARMTIMQHRQAPRISTHRNKSPNVVTRALLRSTVLHRG